MSPGLPRKVVHEWKIVFVLRIVLNGENSETGSHLEWAIKFIYIYYNFSDRFMYSNYKNLLLSERFIEVDVRVRCFLTILNHV